MRSRRFFQLSLLSRLVVIGASLLCLGWVAMLLISRLQAYTRWGGALLLTVGLLSSIVLGYLALRQSDSGIKRIAAELLMLLGSLLAVEALIAIWSPELPRPQLTRMRVAAKLGVAFDARSKTEVVAQMRAQGADAYPGVSREWPQQSAVRQQLPQGLFPLSDASNAWIVECNETGRYLVFRADEFGFNNPAGLINSGSIDIAAVGASFTLGHCLPPAQTLIGRLREFYPRLANFGIAGSGTLAMLGSFREYVEPLRPPLVLWIMHPRTADTDDEARDPTLVQYLDPTFSQHLLQRRNEVDRAWREVAIPVQYEFDHRSAVVIAKARDNRFARIPLLTQLRSRMTPEAPLLVPPPPPTLGLFIRSLQLADATTRGWGGRFVVIIMPLYEEVVARQMPSTLRHEHLAKVVAELGIPVIDGAALFEQQRDPAHLYTMRINNHPNGEGYQLLANHVAAQLARLAPQKVAKAR